MKTIYKSFIAFAAALLLIPAAKAQTPQYLVDKDSGFGFNKYLKSETPDAQGRYTLRIENFATGEVTVEKTSKPSDIILVLDMSGSMLYDYIISGASLADQLIMETGSLTNNYATYDPGNYYQSGSNVGKSQTSARVQNLTNFSQAGTSQSGICVTNYRRFIKVESTFHSVTREVVEKTVDGVKSWYCYLTFTRGGQKYYLFGNQSDEDQGIKAIPNNDPQQIPSEHLFTTNKAVWRGNLYRYPARIEALRNSVQSFITKIAENDRDEVKPYLESGTVGNRISIVKFAGNGYFSGWPSDPETNIAAAIAERNNKAESSVVKQFKTLTNGYGESVSLDTENITALQNTLDRLTGMQANSNTPIDCGANLARLLFLDAEANGYHAVDESGKVKLRNRTVVFFTDGDPVKSGSDFCKITNAALNYAVQMKATGAGAMNSKIFAIGLNPSTSSKPFLERLSSNYPDAVQTSTSGAAGSAHYVGDPIPRYDEEHDPEHKKDLWIYYKDAALVNIQDIFDSIAESAGGGAADASKATLAAIDLVSDSFVLPAGIQASDIKVYTAQCIGTTGETWTDDDGVEHPYLAFAENEDDVKLAGTRDPLQSLWVAKFDDEGNPEIDPETGGQAWEQLTNYTIDGDIDVDFDTDENTVTVAGFDYSKLWCGPDPIETHVNSEDYDKADYADTYKPGYRGFKLIIEFPIVVKDGALGGFNVPTNKPGSGLYRLTDSGDIDEKLYDYPEPKLPIPVNLWIEKRGLRPNESATINIYRKLTVKPEGSTVEPEYEFFQRVNFLGKEDGSPVLEKLLNLDPRYFYKVWEEGWSWSYTNQSGDFDSAPSTETVTTNPIVIKNDYDDPDVKHAEAAKRNKMERTGGN